MLRPRKHNMGHVNGGICDESGQYADSQPPKEETGAPGKPATLRYGHGTSRTFGERSPARAHLFLSAILSSFLCRDNRVCNEGHYKGDQEDDGIADAKKNYDVLRRVPGTHGICHPPIQTISTHEDTYQDTIKVFPIDTTIVSQSLLYERANSDEERSGG